MSGLDDPSRNPNISRLTTAGLPEAKRFTFWRDAVCSHFARIDCFRLSDRPFAGEIATTRVNEIHFSRVRGLEHKCVRTSRQIRQSSEEAVFVNLQMKGTWSSTQDGREAALEPGDFACFDSTRPYSAIQHGEFEQLVVHVPRDLWIRRIGQTQQLTARAVRGNTHLGSLVSDALRRIISVAENAGEETAHRLMELSLALVTTAYGELISHGETRGSSGRVALLYRAKALVEESLHDPDLNPDRIARALKISVRYLQELFREEETTVSSWIWNRRLEKCRHELSDPLFAGRSISQIAFGWGFSDFSHFSHRFKAAFSMSASEFRRERRTDKAKPPLS